MAKHSQKKTLSLYYAFFKGQNYNQTISVALHNFKERKQAENVAQRFIFDL